MSYTKPQTGCLEPTVCYRNLGIYATRWDIDTLPSMIKIMSDRRIDADRMVKKILYYM